MVAVVFFIWLVVVFFIWLVNVVSANSMIVVVVVLVSVVTAVVFESVSLVTVVFFVTVGLLTVVVFVPEVTDIVVDSGRLRAVLVTAIELFKMVEFVGVMVGVSLVEVGFVVFVVSDEVVGKAFIVVAFSVTVT